MAYTLDLRKVKVASYPRQERTHHIHWHFFSANEFHYIDRQEDEYFTTFAEAKARVQELILDWNDYDFSLEVTWYDGDDTGEPYRRFHVCSPDRG